MVLVNLSKLIKFIGFISETPKGITKRNSKLITAYTNLEKKTDDEVSIKMPASLERFKEKHLDAEVTERKFEILEQLINDYTKSSINIPESNDVKKYLVPTPCTCLNENCSGQELVICRPSKTENCVNIFKLNEVLEGEVYRKLCCLCQSIYYYNYWEVMDSSGLNIRTYYDTKEELFFSTTNETYFEKKMLEQLTEDIVTCNVQFVNWATAYNRLKSKGKCEISYKLIIPAWIIFCIWQRMSVSFPVIRDKSRHLDIESICAILYPKLRHQIDKKWLSHICDKCATRLVIMDGDAKAYRTVCSADVTKNITKGELNEFIACAESPLPGKDKCLHHLEDESRTPPERMDYGMMTRARRKELGISIDLLTTEEGCRKREAITVRTARSKTAGMLYCYRPCGISLGHLECIHHETCTAFQLLLFELFGERPETKDLTGVVIDRG